MPKDMADILRDAIRKSEKPLLTIATDTGVSVSLIWAFMQGGDMRLKNASKIAVYLGLELKPKRS
jgi:hypothetical protein